MLFLLRRFEIGVAIHAPAYAQVLDMLWIPATGRPPGHAGAPWRGAALMPGPFLFYLVA